MLQAMREKMALVMWLTIIAFIGTIIFGWGMGGEFGDKDPRGENVIAVINGEKIYFDEFKNILEQQTKMRPNPDQDPVVDAEMREMSWKQLVQTVLLRQQISQNQITASAEEIYQELINNPMPELQNHPDFMENGQFSMAKYQDFIQNPKPEYKAMYVQLENIYANWLPQKLLRDKVLQSVFVSEKDLLDDYNKNNLKADAKFIMASGGEYLPVDSTITDAEIEKYFKENSKEFSAKKEQRAFDYVLFSLEPSFKDSNMVLDDISEALKQINNGVAFEDVARNYSEDGSAENGGDLGFFGKGAMVPEFERAAFGATVGEVVGPVKTQFGYHLIKVTEQKKTGNEVTEVKANHILVKFKTYPSTKDDAQFAARQFVQSLKDDDFVTAVKKAGKELKSHDLIYKGDFVPELGQVPGLSNFLFKGEVGDVSNLLVAKKGYLYITIKKIEKEKSRSFADVKDMAKAKYRSNKGLEMAFNALKGLEGALVDTLSFNQIATQNKMRSGYALNTTKAGYVPNVGKDQIFTQKLFTTPVGKYSEVFKGSMAAYKLFVVNRTEFNQADFDANKKSIHERIKSERQSQMWNDWLSGLEKKAEIVDYRHYYYN